MKILVAEDDELSCRILEQAFGSWGHTVVAAHDGLDAWRKFEADKDSFDVALLDWIMPEMDGIELCRKLRAAQGQRYLYIIIVTSKGKTEDIVEGLKAGADDYVTKPFDIDELGARAGVGERTVKLERTLADKIAELEAALTHVQQLQGLLPMCCYCKKIRDDKNYWQEVERYIEKHTEVKFSHGICPECMEKHVLPALEAHQRKKAAAQGGKQ